MLAIVLVLALSLLAAVSAQSSCYPASRLSLPHCNFLPYDVDVSKSDALYKYPLASDFEVHAWIGIGANYSDCELAYRAWWCLTNIPPCNAPNTPLCSDACYNVVARCGMIPDLPAFTESVACYSSTYAAPGADCRSYVFPQQAPLQCSAPRASEVSFCGPNFSNAVLMGPNHAAALQALGAAQTHLASLSTMSQQNYNVADQTIQRCLAKYRELTCAYLLPICSPADGKVALPCDFGCQSFNDECPYGDPVILPFCAYELLDPTTAGICPARGHFRIGALIGDPHFLTPDGAQYAYNPVGEFYLTKSLPDSGDADVQARFEVCQTGVTCLTAVAFKTSAHSFVISLQGLNASLFQDGVEIVSSDYAADGLSFAKRTDGIFNSTVIWGVNLATSLIDYFIKVDIWGHTSVSVVYHESNNGRLAGLFGYFDGNRDNDYQAYPGTVDSGLQWWNATNTLLGPLFASTWRTTAQTSAMFYPPGKSWADYNNVNFAQTYYDVSAYLPSGLAYSSCVNMDSVFYTGCLFDVTQTGNTDYALSHRSTLLYHDYLSREFGSSSATASRVLNWWLFGLVLVVKGAMSARLFD